MRKSFLLSRLFEHLRSALLFSAIIIIVFEKTTECVVASEATTISCRTWQDARATR